MGIRLFIISAVVAMAAAGCKGGGTDPPLNFSCDWSDPSCPIYTSAPSPTPIPFCAYPSGKKPQLVYPIPGSTGVSDAFNTRGIVIADRSGANYETANSYYLSWLGPESTALAFENDNYPVMLSIFYQITAAQVPQPAATPAFISPVYEDSSTPNEGMLNPIEPHTHYYVYLQRFVDGIDHCWSTGPVGDFTTQ